MWLQKITKTYFQDECRKFWQGGQGFESKVLKEVVLKLEFVHSGMELVQTKYSSLEGIDIFW